MIRFGISAAVLTAVVSCTPVQEPVQLHEIYQRDSIRVGILNSPTSYYVGADGPTGYDYELSVALAEKLGVELELFPSYQREELLQKLIQVRSIT